MSSILRASLVELLALALPTSCASCGAPDDPVCRECASEVAAVTFQPGPVAVAPDPCPAGFPPTHAAAPYSGPLRRLLPAYKDDDRRDCRGLLAELLGTAVEASLVADPALRHTAVSGNGPVLLVPVPTSRQARRRRGDAPLLRLATEAAHGFARSELWCGDALRLRRRVADQAGLGARQRALNLEHAMEPRAAWLPALAGAHCVLVDDVLTTGATLVEARRALLAAGARHVVAATVCATQRRSAGRPAGP